MSVMGIVGNWGSGEREGPPKAAARAVRCGAVVGGERQVRARGSALRRRRSQSCRTGVRGSWPPPAPPCACRSRWFVPLRSDLQVQRIRVAEPMSNWVRW